MNVNGKCKVVRVKPGCCGMVEGHVYDAVLDYPYVRVELTKYAQHPMDDDEKYLSSSHYVPGFFEVINDDTKHVTLTLDEKSGEVQRKE